MAIILIDISTAKKAKMKSSSIWRINNNNNNNRWWNIQHHTQHIVLVLSIFHVSCCVCYLEDSASIGVADLVDTRLVHAQRDAVEENDGHADPLEPRVEFSKS